MSDFASRPTKDVSYSHATYTKYTSYKYENGTVTHIILIKPSDQTSHISTKVKESNSNT